MTRLDFDLNLRLHQKIMYTSSEGSCESKPLLHQSRVPVKMRFIYVHTYMAHVHIATCGNPYFNHFQINGILLKARVFVQQKRVTCAFSTRCTRFWI